MLKKFSIFITAAALIGLFFYFGYRKAEQDFVARQSESAEFQVRLKQNDLSQLATEEVPSTQKVDKTKGIDLEPVRIEPLVPKPSTKTSTVQQQNVALKSQQTPNPEAKAKVKNETLVAANVKTNVANSGVVAKSKVEVANTPQEYQQLMQKHQTANLYQSPLFDKPANSGNKTQVTVPVDDTQDTYTSIAEPAMQPKQANVNSQLVSQSFQIDNRIDTVLIGKYGTVIYVPRNCFHTTSGTDNLSKVTLEIQEALYDLTSKLQRLQKASDEQTGFVDAAVFISAKANGKELDLKPGTQIYVELPAQMHLLSEAYEKNLDDNSVNTLSKMKYAESASNSPTMIEMPLQALNFDRYFNLCTSKQNVTVDLKSPKFEHTFIATREFEDRLRAIAKTCVYTHELVSLYVNNINKELWEVDYLAYNFIREKYSPNLSADRSTKSLYAQNLINQFRFFYEQGNTQVQPIYQYGFDVTAPGALEKLIVRGYGPEHAREVVQLAAIREKLVQNVTSNPNTYSAAKYAFKVTSLGWVEAEYRYPNTGIAMH